MTDGWTFACSDWEDRLKAGRSLVPDLPLDKEEADRAVGIFNRLHLPDVPGKPTLKEAGAQWQRDIAAAVFGSLIDGVRKVPELFVMVPKKNSKTTGGAALTLTALLMNQRPRAEFIYAGPTQEVADLAFQQTVGMIEADQDGFLARRFHVAQHIKTITDRKTKSKLKIKTFDMKVVVGSKPAFVLLDELHLMSSVTGADRIIGQIRGGMLPIPEAAMIIITTQSDEPPSGVFKTELQYARGVRDGRITEHVRLLPVLYEFPEAVQTDPLKPWKNPVNWPQVLPNLGKSITLDRLVGEYATAREKGEQEERRWASQHLNVEIGLALHNDRWRGADYWLNNVEPELLDLESLLARSEVLTAGIDGGGLDDMGALAIVGRDKMTKEWLAWSHGWVHHKVLDLRKDIAVKLEDFAADGDLTICNSATQWIEDVALKLAGVRKSGLLPDKLGIGLDPYGVAALVDALADEKMAGDLLSAIRQGAALSPTTWGLEIKLENGTFRHGGSRLMSWVVSNARVEQRGNATLITKQVSGKAKIDPLIAIFNAAALMSRNPIAKSQPQYQVMFV